MCGKRVKGKGTKARALALEDIDGFITPLLQLLACCPIMIGIRSYICVIWYASVRLMKLFDAYFVLDLYLTPCILDVGRSASHGPELKRSIP